MFQKNAEMFWNFRHKQVPDSIEFIGSYPKENPVNHVFKLSKNEFSSHVVIQETNAGLMTREIVDQNELDFLEDMDVRDSNTNRESTE